MGWLWNQIHDIFDEDDGSYPEICICGLTTPEVIAAYRLIRNQARFLVGKPRFLHHETGSETELDQVACAATLVCEQKASPFHFMVRNLTINRREVHEIGVFVFANAIAIDYEKSRIWGESQIEGLLRLVNQILGSAEKAFLRFEETLGPADRQRIETALHRLANPHPDD
ncbi:MAG TPA: hypothetical protein PLM07_13045 [Candidatus Rifleibacterium sp.]|nr:hypothetical protein [Candidatus Rifleibacterium sp.]HPT46811.1 hypothetical protein [Candidatus Rifleibacterium sp.]